MKKVLFIFLLLFPAAVYAGATDVRITEIMYDPAGGDGVSGGNGHEHEWMELWNGGNDSVTIVSGSGASGWRFSDGSNHTFTSPPALGSLALAPGDFLIISAKTETFLADYSSFSGNLVKVSFSLGNTLDDSSETLFLRIGTSGTPWSEVSYTRSQGGNNNGKTLEWNRETLAWSESANVGGSPGNFGAPAAAPPPPPPAPAETPAPELDAPPPPEPTAETAPPSPPSTTPADAPLPTAEPVPETAININNEG